MSAQFDLNLDCFDNPPWDGNPISVPVNNTSAEEPELEFYRKAKNFDRLTLISGGSISESVDSFVKNNYGQEGVIRLKLARFLIGQLGYVPADDVLLLLSCPSKARVVIATAGAGKTTSLQLDLVLSKMLDTVTHQYHLDPVPIEGTGVTVPSILYLNYNRHNVQPIVNRHSAICAQINMKIEEKIEDSIESTTVHAFCHKWLGAFRHYMTLPEFKISSDEDRKTVWMSVIEPRWKKFYGDNVDYMVDWEVLDELYVFKTESMMDFDRLFETAKFIDKDLNSDFVKSCIKKYESMKKLMNLMDFTDYLVQMIDILKTHEDLRSILQDRYKIIVADENQDFTALMNELLLQIYNPEKNRLIVVGDPDQTIYSFKGVSPDNVVNLVDRLEDSIVLGLDTNYRCPDGIVDAAKAILDLNVMRFKKPINTVRTGGEIIGYPVSTIKSQADTVLRILQKNGTDHYGSTVITYRNNRSAMLIGEELYYANIPFSVLDDRRPFNNVIFSQLRNALQALKTKDDLELNKKLYRFLPISAAVWSKILDMNAQCRNYYLSSLVLPDGMPSGSTTALAELVKMSELIDTCPVSDFFGNLVRLYRKYYFDFIMRNPNPLIGDEEQYLFLLERAELFWCRPYTYDYLCKEITERNVDRPDAVKLSTFHGLKGLEFNHVIAIDFNDSIFPNYFGIEQRYPPNTAAEEKEAENRLCYVLVTRAIKCLHLCYFDSDPSSYLPLLLNKKDGNDDAEEVKTINLGSVSMPGDATTARLNFIQRLTGG